MIIILPSKLHNFSKTFLLHGCELLIYLLRYLPCFKPKAYRIAGQNLVLSPQQIPF